MRGRVLASVGLAAVIVGAGVVVGSRLGHSPATATHSTQVQPTSPAAEVPRTIVPTSTASMPPPTCSESEELTQLPLRDKLAQLLMVGVTSEREARSVIADYHVGGIFITSWTDLSMLSSGALKQLAASTTPLPVAVSVDEEGGRVSRLSALIGKAPSARVLAQTQTPEETYQLALERGKQMRSLGITVDFAPVLDVSSAADDTVIGDRSFGVEPSVVTQYAGQYAKGLREAGILPVLKHFPGHGHASGDSHQTGVTTPPLDQLVQNDLTPYRYLVGNSPVGVMVGHLDVPELTEGQPASLSSAAVSLLRNGTGYGGPPFDGPIFTDDLSSMRAITDRYSVPQAVLKALQAGVDVALWVSTAEVPAVLDRLDSAVKAGELNEAGIDSSVSRLAAAKTWMAGCPR